MYCFSSLEAEHVTLHVATLHQYPFGHRSNLLMAKTKLNPLWVSQHFPILEYLVQKSDLTKLSCWSSYLCIHWRPRETLHQSFKNHLNGKTFNWGLKLLISHTQIRAWNKWTVRECVVYKPIKTLRFSINIRLHQVFPLLQVSNRSTHTFFFSDLNFAV